MGALEGLRERPIANAAVYRPFVTQFRIVCAIEHLKTLLNKRARFCRSQSISATENQRPGPKQLRAAKSQPRSAQNRRLWDISGATRHDCTIYARARRQVSGVCDFLKSAALESTCSAQPATYGMACAVNLAKGHEFTRARPCRHPEFLLPLPPGEGWCERVFSWLPGASKAGICLTWLA